MAINYQQHRISFVQDQIIGLKSMIFLYHHALYTLKYCTILVPLCRIYIPDELFSKRKSY